MQHQLTVLKRVKIDVGEDIINFLYQENIKSHSFDTEFEELMKKI